MYDYETHQLVFQIVTGVIVLLSIVGNLVVCYRFFRDKRLLKEYSLFLSLAVANLLLTVTSNIRLFILNFLSNEWILGDILCKFIETLRVLAEACSAYTIVALLLYQFWPSLLKTALGPRLQLMLNILPWCISSLIALPHLYLALVYHRGNYKQCSPLGIMTYQTYDVSKYYMSLYDTVYYSLTGFLPLILGVAVFLKANPVKLFSYRPEHLLKLKSCTAVLVIFVITSLPYEIFVVVDAWTDYGLPYYPIVLDFYLLLINSSAVAINPYIFLIFHTKIFHCGPTEPTETWSNVETTSKISLLTGNTAVVDDDHSAESCPTELSSAVVDQNEVVISEK